MDSDIHSGSTDSNEATSIDIERTAELADILRNPRRIQVILELESAGEGGMTMGALADRVAEREHGPEFYSEERKSVFVALYQSHAPKLEAWDVVVCDCNEITRGRRFNEVVSALGRL